MGSSQSKVADVSVAKKKKKPEFEAPENDYQLVFEAIKNLEHTLMASFDSTGDSLHEMISTTNEKLPLDLIIDMRALATVRNNLAHEYSCDGLPERAAFIEKYKKCVERLEEEINRRKTDEEKFYNEVVQKHRQLHPRPTFLVDEENKPVVAEQPAAEQPNSSWACF